MAAIQELAQEAVVTSPGVRRMTRRQLRSQIVKLRRERDKLIKMLRSQRQKFVRLRTRALNFRLTPAMRNVAIQRGNTLRGQMRSTAARLRAVRAQLTQLVLARATRRSG